MTAELENQSQVQEPVKLTIEKTIDEYIQNPTGLPIPELVDEEVEIDEDG